MKKLKEEWGGYREGSGRKPSDEPKKNSFFVAKYKICSKNREVEKRKKSFSVCR